jgi:hypothetical protein
VWSETSNLREGPCDITYMGFTKALAKAMKGNRNASMQRSESRGAEDVARGDQRGTSTSAATSLQEILFLISVRRAYTHC